MTVDYDTPRRTRVEDREEPIDALAGRRPDAVEGSPDIDDDSVDLYLLPDADLSGEELMVAVIPKQADEFTCMSCFLVHHRSRLASSGDPAGVPLCTDCA